MAEKENHIDDKLKEWMDGAISDQEWSEIKQKASNPRELERYEQITKKAEQLKVPESGSTEEAWNLIRDKIREEDTTPVVSLPLWRKRSFQMGIAASILLLMAAIGLYQVNFSNEIIATRAGQHLSHILPDGSEILINANSTIEYSKSDWEEERLVMLKGEAFFKVETGEQFSVETRRGLVRVLGTQFNVKARTNTFTVACTEGKVEVSNEFNKVLLTSGLYTALENNRLIKPSSFNQQHQLGWRQGQFVYQNAKLSGVLDEIEIQFGISISTEVNIDDRRYSGFFTRDDLEAALKSVLEPMELTYRIEGDEVFIK